MRLKVVNFHRFHAEDAAGAKRPRGQFVAKPPLNYFDLEAGCLVGLTERALAKKLGTTQNRVHRELVRYHLCTKGAAAKERQRQRRRRETDHVSPE